MTSVSQSPADVLTILHWNIHSWRDNHGASNIDAVADLVRATTPHVVCLVEVDESWDQPSALDELAVQTGYTSIFMPAFEFGRDQPVGGFGNALLSRLPILTARQRQLVWPPTLYDGTEQSEPRSVVFAKIQASNGPVWIGSTHLPRSKEDMRLDALQRLIRVVRRLPEPWLLAGDFNMPAASWINEQPSWRAYPTPPEPTYPSTKPVEAIDYCVAPENLAVEAEALAEIGSDHMPVVIRCELNRPESELALEPRAHR